MTISFSLYFVFALLHFILMTMRSWLRHLIPDTLIQQRFSQYPKNQSAPVESLKPKFAFAVFYFEVRFCSSCPSLFLRGKAGGGQHTKKLVFRTERFDAAYLCPLSHWSGLKTLQSSCRWGDAQLLGGNNLSRLCAASRCVLLNERTVMIPPTDLCILFFFRPVLLLPDHSGNDFSSVWIYVTHSLLVIEALMSSDCSLLAENSPDVNVPHCCTNTEVPLHR